MGSVTTVCFYSYKGGTGRSTALANVATYLASKGKRVGCIDLDIESPGLNYIFKVETGENTITDLLRKNILEYPEIIPKCIVDLKSKCGDLVGEEDEGLKKKIIELSGEIYLMPAACEFARISGVEYTKKLADNMRAIINIFGETKKLDYVLLDARSGMSDPSIMALILSNIILLFFRLDRQGKKSAYSWIHEYDNVISKQKDAPHVVLIASNVPTEGAAEKIIKQVNVDIDDLSGGKRKINHRLDRESALELEEEIVFLKNLDLKSNIKTQYEKLGEILLKFGR